MLRCPTQVKGECLPEYPITGRGGGDAMTANTSQTTYEPTTSPAEWEEFCATLLKDPRDRDEYERELREIVALRKILQQCEAERERVGLTKAALAQRVGMNPASIRRLLTAEGSNPTLKTILGILAALDLEIVVRPAHRRRRTKQRPPARPTDRPDAAA